MAAWLHRVLVMAVVVKKQTSWLHQVRIRSYARGDNALLHINHDVVTAVHSSSIGIPETTGCPCCTGAVIVSKRYWRLSDEGCESTTTR